MKFDKVQDALAYVNEQLRRKGFLRESEALRLRPHADDDAGLLQLADDRRAINTINKLLNRVAALEAQLRAQESRVPRERSARDRSPRRSPPSRSPPPRSPPPRSPRSPPPRSPASAPVGRARTFRPDRAAQAQLRRLQLRVDQLREQLHAASRAGGPPDVTWGAPLPLPDPAADPPGPQADLPTALADLAREHTAAAAALRDAKLLLEHTNRYVYTKFVLGLRPDLPPPPLPEDPDLRELLRDWDEIRALLPRT
ncbi:AGR294C-Ap [Eremothecium gossypii ATCC 10895]|uniref:AGR294C-Ap n=1 Tax=Eremothecium gossypii (strain ATCC 10895 / CBS 109.51 / FGSC 9923 / NRRL Y-1056) TaxID=284811 RepID=D8FGG7_EREGS|nr:AGR294C-Ap [Eremothecium gossypii ATCC 10895]ADJ41744.1 AGR294C-Ap [Eremothecium gossypii ATCC 10895]AEY99116.1 FAGR294C-Ap [Eremothecium gossypii FDAG1]